MRLKIVIYLAKLMRDFSFLSSADVAISARFDLIELFLLLEYRKWVGLRVEEPFVETYQLVFGEN